MLKYNVVNKHLNVAPKLLETHEEMAGEEVLMGCTHRLADEPVSVTHLDLAVKPDCGHLFQPLEAERVELEHGAAVFGILKNGHGDVGGAAV